MKYNAHGQEMEMLPTFPMMLREYLLSSLLLLQFFCFYGFLSFRALPRRQREHRVSSTEKKMKSYSNICIKQKYV